MTEAGDPPATQDPPGHLEGGADSQAEGLAGLPELVERAVELLGLSVAEVACASCGEHVAGDEVFAADLLEEAQRIVGVVDAEWRTDDGQEHGDLCAGGHAGNRVRSLDRPDIPAERNLGSALAGAADVDGAAVERRVELIDGDDALDELRLAHGDGHAEVVKEFEGDRPPERDAVLDIAGERGIATDGDDAEGRDGDGDVAQRGVSGIAGNERAIRVGEDELRALRNEAIGSGRADIKAAEFLLAALIEALEGRGHLAADALNVLSLETEGEDIAALFAGLDAVHAIEVAEFEDRVVVL